MVGLIQKILFNMILDIKGEETLREIKVMAGLSPELDYQINTVYSDKDWQRLLAATMKVLNLSPAEVDTLYAEYFGKDAIARFPAWFKMAKNSYEFILMQPIIHNCFATGVRDPKERSAIQDKFKIEKFPNKVITHYNSPNHLCGLYQSLAKWVINYYKDKATVEEKKCALKGDSECEIHIEWTKMENKSDESKAATRT